MSAVKNHLPIAHLTDAPKYRVTLYTSDGAQMFELFAAENLADFYADRMRQIMQSAGVPVFFYKERIEP